MAHFWGNLFGINPLILKLHVCVTAVLLAHSIIASLVERYSLVYFGIQLSQGLDEILLDLYVVHYGRYQIFTLYITAIGSTAKTNVGRRLLV